MAGPIVGACYRDLAVVVWSRGRGIRALHCTGKKIETNFDRLIENRGSPNAGIKVELREYRSSMRRRIGRAGRAPGSRGRRVFVIPAPQKATKTLHLAEDGGRIARFLGSNKHGGGPVRTPVPVASAGCSRSGLVRVHR